ncbi:alpha/beta-hydrolase [Aspergillus heterothallicus]
MSSLPTILLIHGAWHTRQNYASFAAALRARGFPVHCPLLPSCDELRSPRGSFADDVRAVRELATKLVDSGERILMVMHSYGGAVGTDAVQGLEFPYTGSGSDPAADASRSEGSKAAGGVVHLLYLCAYMLPPGMSLWDIVCEAGFDAIWDEHIEEASEDESIFPIDPATMFFGGDETISKEVVEEGLKTLVRFPKGCISARTAGDAWRSLPATYVLTNRDFAVPRVYQDNMLAKIRKEGVVLRMLDFDTCHSIFISREVEMVELAVEAARDPRNVRNSLD